MLLFNPLTEFKYSLICLSKDKIKWNAQFIKAKLSTIIKNIS